MSRSSPSWTYWMQPMEIKATIIIRSHAYKNNAENERHKKNAVKQIAAENLCARCDWKIEWTGEACEWNRKTNHQRNGKTLDLSRFCNGIYKCRLPESWRLFVLYLFWLCVECAPRCVFSIVVFWVVRLFVRFHSDVDAFIVQWHSLFSRFITNHFAREMFRDAAKIGYVYEHWGSALDLLLIQITHTWLVMTDKRLLRSYIIFYDSLSFATDIDETICQWWAVPYHHKTLHTHKKTIRCGGKCPKSDTQLQSKHQKIK